jgi:hypothetical protein
MNWYKYRYAIPHALISTWPAVSCRVGGCFPSPPVKGFPMTNTDTTSPAQAVANWTRRIKGLVPEISACQRRVAIHLGQGAC